MTTKFFFQNKNSEKQHIIAYLGSINKLHYIITALQMKWKRVLIANKCKNI